MNKLLTVLGILPALIFAAAAADDRPNIVLIMADDLSHANLPVYGAANFDTPHLDQLAAQGMRFTHCYSLPLCTPSRIAIMTGQHNGRNHVDTSYLEKSQRTFGAVAKEAGYATCLAGKWKLAGKGGVSLPDRFGFDEYCVTEGKRNDSPRYKNPDILQNGKLTHHSQGEYGPDITRDFAIDFIERHRDQPFLLYLPMVLVHSPIAPLPNTADYAAADQYTEAKANYPAMVSRMDDDVGRIVAKLEALDLRKRTLVIFTSDNGTKKTFTMMMKDGSTYPGGKGLTSDTGVHVPLIVSQPGRVPVGVCDALVDFTDFFPTISEVLGVKLSPDVPCDGQSFFAHCLGKESAPARAWIYQWFANNPRQDKVIECVFNRGYRLYADERFYDLAADRDEQHPLKLPELTPPQRAVREELQAALKTSQAGFTRPGAK